MNPEVTQTVNERGLGVLDGSARNTHMVVAVAASGTVDTPLVTSNPSEIVDTFTSGPLVDAAAFSLEQSGGGPLMCVRAATDVAGAAGSVSEVKTGTGSVSVAGGAADAYSVIVEILQPGGITIGTASFRYTLDGGENYSQPIAVPLAVGPATTSTYPLETTGLTLTFSHSTGDGFEAGDTFSFTTTAPTTNASLVSAAITAGLADSTTVAFIHVVGAAATASAAAALATALGSQLASAANSHQYLFVLMECPDITKTDAKAAFTTFADNRVMVAYGMVDYLSSLLDRKRVLRRSAAWAIAARLSAVDPGQSAAETNGGALGGILSLVHDEGGAGDMDDARFACLRTFPGSDLVGFYVHMPRMMAQPGSDFSQAQYRRCMDIACRVNRSAMLLYLHSRLGVNTQTGKLLEAQARSIESEVSQKLRAALKETGDVVEVFSQVDRTNNILSTGELKSTVSIIPFSYPSIISTRLTYFNPALRTAALA
jgi:hypothetical protein